MPKAGVHAARTVGANAWASHATDFDGRGLVPACQRSGPSVSPLTFEGYCDSELVEAWLEQELLPVLRPGQMVILDNASFHRKEHLRQLLSQVGCALLSLPAYSRDLNRIEPLWQRIKRKIALCQEAHWAFIQKVDAAFCSL